MNKKKNRIVMVLLAIALVLGLISACDMADTGTPVTSEPGPDGAMLSTANNWENGMTSDGKWYYQWWNNNLGSLTFDYLGNDTYSTNWQRASNPDSEYPINPDTGDYYRWNFTAGTGWGMGSDDKVVKFDASSIDFGSNGYLALYGWAENGYPVNQPIEYYVIEDYGPWDPPFGAPASYNVGHDNVTQWEKDYTCDGGTYHLFKIEYKVNQPWIKGDVSEKGNFMQYVSVRDRADKRSSGTITFSKHIEQWRDNLGSIDDLRYYQIMETEGYDSSGNSEVKVWEDTTGTGPFFNLIGKWAHGGLNILGLGEDRIPRSPTTQQAAEPLDGIWSALAFHEKDGTRIKVSLVHPPVDKATTTKIRDKKYLDSDDYDSTNPAKRAGQKARAELSNAAEEKEILDAVWAFTSDNGSKMKIVGLKSGGIELKEFYLTIRTVNTNPPPGTPYQEIEYSYYYEMDGQTWDANGTLWLGKNPKSIPTNIANAADSAGSAGSEEISTASNTIELGSYPGAWQAYGISPTAIDTGDSYSFGSKWSGKHVTVTSTESNAVVKAQPVNEGWTSQDWVAEEVYGETNIIRIRNIWTGKYLHAQSNEENAKAVCYDLHSDWWSQQWVVEQIGYDLIRLKNRWSNKYLTVVDNGDYADIILKNLNTSWASQEWDVDLLKFH